MKLKVLVYEDKEEGGYTAEVPALPGCYTEGNTMDELLANVKVAAEGWLEVASERTPDAPPTHVIELDL